MAKCSECGFIATWNNATGQWEEVEQNQRQTGRTQIRGVGPQPLVLLGAQFSHPFCLIRAFDLPCEYKQERSETPVLAVLQRERACLSFREWQQGFSPKEHREMMDRERFEERLREDKKSDRRWRIIELFCLLVGSGLFTLLGAWIAKR